MKKGFSLVELLISLVIFFFVLFALQGLFSTVWTTQFRALAMKKLADNTRTTLEIMGREMRLASGDPSTCAGMGGEIFKVGGLGKSIKFKDFSGRCVIYELQGTTLEKGINDETDCNGMACEAFLGGSKIRLTNLNFQVIADPPPPPNPTRQPRIIINMTVETDDPTAQNQKLTIALETMVSQRELNVP